MERYCVGVMVVIECVQWGIITAGVRSRGKCCTANNQQVTLCNGRRLTSLRSEPLEGNMIKGLPQQDMFGVLTINCHVGIGEVAAQ